ncbi:MAG: phosphoribosyltransferase family protein [Methanomassiliicoccales archaeon]
MPLGQVHQDLNLREMERVFQDRKEAGRELAEALMSYSASNAVVFAIPSGGLPVAAEVSRLLGLKLEVLVVRKLQLPQDPEAGFGAVGPEGIIVLNEYLISVNRLSHFIIEEQAAKARRSLRFREELFRDNAPYPDMKDRTAIIVDDELASGFTMLAAVQFMRKKGAKRIVVAVPTGSERAVEMVSESADEVYCLNIRSTPLFSVAAAYQNWYDISEEEALAILKARV